MTKDEMKDKISMALKDPILQIGFEVICSKLSRLEKENAELDCQMNRNKYCHSCVNATDRCFRKEVGCPCEKYNSYKDENAELKEQIEKMKCCENCRHYSHTYGHCYSYDSYQNCKSLSNWRLAEC